MARFYLEVVDNLCLEALYTYVSVRSQLRKKEKVIVHIFINMHSGLALPVQKHLFF